MAKDMFDQVKFIAGLGVFLYAVYSIWGTKPAGITPIGLGLPPLSDFGLGGSGLQARDTPNCNDATNECVCPGGSVFQMGASRTCADCSAECAKRAGDGGTASSNMGYFYGMNIRDHGLPWQLTGWEKSEAVGRLTIA